MDGARRASPATGCRGDGGGRHSPERAGVAATPQRPGRVPASGARRLRTAPRVTPGAPPGAGRRGSTPPHSPTRCSAHRPSMCHSAGLDAPTQPRGSRPVPAVRQAQPAGLDPSAQPPKPQPASTRNRTGQAPATTPSPLAKHDRGSAPPTGGTTGGIRASALCNCRPPRLSAGGSGVIRWRGGRQQQLPHMCRPARAAWEV